MPQIYKNPQSCIDRLTHSCSLSFLSIFHSLAIWTQCAVLHAALTGPAYVKPACDADL